ncbi:neutral zinc metallopeptidase [Aliarcobacter lanthieri]|uniref:KPN_02809 family neutral zinc metallopeptidase n=1 Tax=Aliarcobacter lanthieri TaxID=1355374 RepID=UPI00047A5954|nr:neutral zinc metallopeptidase [Aliarcobacter lanthieri]QKF59373.1 putative neutral zinc metallopeptidase [Aliarcobacter lanthieri]
MKWEDNRRSSNVEDRRGETQNFGSRTSGSSMVALLPLIKALLGTKIGRIILIVSVVAYFIFGINPLALLDGGTQSNQTNKVVNQAQDDKSAMFVSAILAQTEDIWANIFKENGLRYQEPKLVLFRGGVKSACGFASSQVGPFYCSVDRKVYLDLSFFDELAKKYKAPGDFAQAYVIAHEIGHHIQNLLGTLNKVQQAKSSLSATKQNALQVQVELQADCYSGVWAYHSQAIFNSLEDGDLEDALNAANAIGDDTLQKQAQGYVVPDSFTHGTSKQRMEAFKKGFKNGDLETCSF